MNLPAKSLALVISAIKNLREMRGSTSKEILHYLSSVYDVPAKVAHRQMQAALKRGVAYGILRKNGGHYVLPTSTEAQYNEVAAQEIDLLDACRRRRRRKKRSHRRGCKKVRRSRRSCKCKRKRSSMRKSRRSSRGCKRRSSRRRRKCKCGGLKNRSYQKSIKRADTPNSGGRFVDDAPLDLKFDENNSIHTDCSNSRSSISSTEA